MDAKQLAKIKARAEEAQSEGFSLQQFDDLETLIEEVERLRDCKCFDKCKLVCMLDKYDKMVAERDTLIKQRDGARQDCAVDERLNMELTDENATLKKALELAVKSKESAIQPNKELCDYYIQQAQEQEATHE